MRRRCKNIIFSPLHDRASSCGGASVVQRSVLVFCHPGMGMPWRTDGELSGKRSIEGHIKEVVGSLNIRAVITFTGSSVELVAIDVYDLLVLAMNTNYTYISSRSESITSGCNELI